MLLGEGSVCVCVCVCVGRGGGTRLATMFCNSCMRYWHIQSSVSTYCEAGGGEEAPLGWGVENRHYYVALTSIHCYRIETVVDS